MKRILLFSLSLFFASPYCWGESSLLHLDLTRWSAHFQATVLPQWHPPFKTSYSGPNSLSPDYEYKTSYTSTLFLGARLWSGGEFYVDPELSAGQGFSNTTGLAGFPNAEIYRVGDPDPHISLARLFMRQTFGFDGGDEQIVSDQNQLQTAQPLHRLTVLFGKFSLTDYFDANAYSHDPRTQFFNWALMANGAWDYAADTRGYTWGMLAEYNRPKWALRLASVMVPKEANQLEMDENIHAAHGDNMEFEYRYRIRSHAGTLRLNSYMNHARMGDYRTTINTPGFGLDIAKSRQYTVKYGFGLNLEQEITSDLGTFLRLGWNDGQTETWAFTEIDRALSLGASLKGASWRRPDDTVGIAVLMNGLSKDHRDYLAAGGSGFIVGDGALRYAPEEMMEAYYSIAVFKGLFLTADFQGIDNPAYNQDRGPVAVISGRIHYQI